MQGLSFFLLAQMFTAEDFVQFYLCKGYEVITDLGFKRHLIQCKELGEQWAVEMHMHQTRVLQACKRVQTQIFQIGESPQHRAWAKICKDAMASAQPPIRVFTGPTKCAITGDDLDYSLDLTKSGKHARETHVSTRFNHFFLFLWFIAKIEYIVRSCTKQWIEANGHTEAKKNKEKYTQLCETFKEDNMDMIQRMGTVFLKSIDYVEKSIEEYKRDFSVSVVLVPSDEWITNASSETIVDF